MKMSLTTEDQENRSNNFDAQAYAAINNFVNTGQQSYEGFVNNFIYLTAEDIANSANQPEVQQIPEEGSSELISAVSLNNIVRQSDDELDEEVLGEGQCCGIMSQTGAGSSSTRLKVDNFFDADNEDALGDGEMLSGNGYVASFGESLGNIETRLCQKQDSNASEGRLNAAIRQSSDQTTSESVDGSCSMQEMLPSETSTNAGEAEKKETIEPKHQEKVNYNKLSNDTKLTHQGPSADEIQLQMCYDDAPFPGEIEDEEDVKEVVPNIRQLDFTSRVRDPTEIDMSQDDTKGCSDEVLPFTIDEDFDYDNVVLTPKYSQEDLEFMQRARDMYAAKT